MTLGPGSQSRRQRSVNDGEFELPQNLSLASTVGDLISQSGAGTLTYMRPVDQKRKVFCHMLRAHDVRTNAPLPKDAFYDLVRQVSPSLIEWAGRLWFDIVGQHERSVELDTWNTFEWARQC